MRWSPSLRRFESDEPLRPIARPRPVPAAPAVEELLGPGGPATRRGRRKLADDPAARELLARLARNVHARRTAMGLTINKAALSSGVFHVTWRAVEKGTSWPSAGTLAAIAAALGCGAWELLRPPALQVQRTQPSDQAEQDPAVEAANEPL